MWWAAQRALARGHHIKGCNCKNSRCLKKYCECFLAQTRCSDMCRCMPHPLPLIFHACLSPAHRRQLLRNSRMISMRRSCLATQMQQLAYHVTAAGLHGVCLSGAGGIQSRQAASISSVFGSLGCADHSRMLSVPSFGYAGV